MTFGATKVRPGAGLLLPILLSVLLSAVRLHALPGETELSGVVRDPSSNVIAGAAITLVNVGHWRHQNGCERQGRAVQDG